MSAAAVVLCLGAVLAACGGGSDDDGYVAVGAAGSGPERAPGRAVPPEGKVELVPLDGDSARAGGDGDSGDGRGSPPPSSPSSSAPEGGDEDRDRGTPGAGGGEEPSGEGGSPGSTDAPEVPGVPDDGDESNSGGGGDNGSDGGTSTKPPVTGSPGAPSSPEPPAGPAVLKLGDPVLAAGEKRWCEKVTVPFRNAGESAVRSGTVTFATHIIGALGIDWDTRISTQPLPGPIAAGAAVKKTYTVCVDAWRVPLGMRVETQDVTADWK
ncbi:hypothetical protein [Streptomyces sp. ISL-100]|uniref:hypothetical protein n=1 Tax=Streptomyces sp. ISL-100 TaxID=2819173 RepID=UPI002035C741|nr:hypothetical protein [Streptomyces sp. ISL-100]